MRKLVICGMCLMSLLAGQVDAQESRDSDTSSETYETIVYSIRSAAADQIGETLLEFFDGSDIRVVAEPANNMLLLRVPSSSRKEVLSVIEQLDRPARSILIELHLLKSSNDETDSAIDLDQLSGPLTDVRNRIRMLEAEGVMYAADRILLTVVENQKTVFQVGKTVAVVTGATSFGGSRQINAYSDRQVGTLASVQAVASDDGGIVLNLQFEKSEVERVEPVDEDEQPVPASTVSITHQSTVQLKDGYSVLAGTLVGRVDDESNSSFLVVGARLQNDGGAVSFRSFSRTAPAPRGGFAARGSGSAARGFSSASRGSDARSTNTSSQRGGSSGGFAPRSAVSRARSSTSDRYRQYATGLVKRYDKNGDNKLSAEERKPMSQDYTKADTNKDGEVSIEEITNLLRQ